MNRANTGFHAVKVTRCSSDVTKTAAVLWKHFISADGWMFRCELNKVAKLEFLKTLSVILHFMREDGRGLQKFSRLSAPLMMWSLFCQNIIA